MENDKNEICGITINDYYKEYSDYNHVKNAVLRQREILFSDKTLSIADNSFLFRIHSNKGNPINYYTPKEFLLESTDCYALYPYRVNGGDGNNSYSKIGLIINELKYSKNLTDEEINAKLSQLCELISATIQAILSVVSGSFYLIPAPSFKLDDESLSKKVPYRVTTYLSESNILPGAILDQKSVQKVSNVFAKTMAKDGKEFSDEDFGAKEFPTVYPIVIIDDLYGQGNTARAVIKAIRKNNKRNKIIFISLTYNKFGGIN